MPSTVTRQFIWYNKHIQIGNKSIYLYNFSNRNLNFVGELFDTDGKSWDCIKHAVSILANYTCSTTVLERNYETIFGNLNNLYIQDHHLIKFNTIYNLEKLSSKELYHMQLLLRYDKCTCQGYHKKSFDDYVFN